MSTLIERLRSRLARRDTDGLALLDVLLGMAIFALIAVIAVQAMGTFRERAYVTQATSDAKQLGTGIEAARIGSAAYPASVDTAASGVPGINLTGGVEVARYAVTGDAFKVCVVKKDGATTKSHALYDSARGSVTSAGLGAGPADCTPTPPAPPEFVNGVACPNITWGTPVPKYLNETTEYRVSAIYNDPTISRITEIGGVSVYIDQGALRRFDFLRSTGVNFVNAPMKVRGSNGFVRTDCTTTFTWPPD